MDESKNRIVRYDDGKQERTYKMAGLTLELKVSVKMPASEFEQMTNAETLELKKEIQTMLDGIPNGELYKVFSAEVNEIRPARGFVVEMKTTVKGK